MRASRPPSGRRRPTPCRRSGARPIAARPRAAGRPPAARAGPRARRGAGARGWRTGRGGDASGRRRAGLRAVAPGRILSLESDVLTDRSIASEEKRRLILDAAVRVFARKGYHTCRVGDIAEEAGVAHGLLYHYFSSKEELLETVFRETWAELLEAVRPGRGVRASRRPSSYGSSRRSCCGRGGATRTSCACSCARSGGARRCPTGSTEIGQRRSRRSGGRSSAARPRGSSARDLDPKLASWIFYGGIEEVLTGWVLGQLDDGDEDGRGGRARRSSRSSSPASLAARPRSRAAEPEAPERLADHVEVGHGRAAAASGARSSRGSRRGRARRRARSRAWPGRRAGARGRFASPAATSG